MANNVKFYGEKMKIIGFHSGHDAAYGILDEGVPVIHNELERFSRRKNDRGNSVNFFLATGKTDDVDFMTTNRSGGIKDTGIESFDKLNGIICKRTKNDVSYTITGHHQAHAANAFFTSDFESALIFTFDGGGLDYPDGSVHVKESLDDKMYDKETYRTCATIWKGQDNKIEPIQVINGDWQNIGYYWARCTSVIFGLGTVHSPQGDQAGTVMGMAALGDPDKYYEYFSNLSEANHHKGIKQGNDWLPSNLDELIKLAGESEQNQFDIAAGLQKATEKIIRNTMTPYVEEYKPKNICLSGGVSLNCVAVGKMYDWFPGVKIFCDPIPYDAGLALGTSRYVWHNLLDKPRIYGNPQNRTPYLGYTYGLNAVNEALEKRKNEITIEKTTDSDVVDLMIDKKIISVFGGGSESGRRALGNRSILADPRYEETKDIVNEKVKHRQWFRPFAPSIMREHVKDWFVHDVDSPYMSVAVPFISNKLGEVPAVVHFDGSARLQTVAEEDNKWYYNFITCFRDKTGVPIVLNTSFNDREPIVETPDNGLDCFLRTNIDFLYFRDFGILVSKNE